MTWQAGVRGVVECLRPAHGAVFYVSRGGKWLRFGSRVPTSERPPDELGQALDAVLLPARVTPTLPDSGSTEPLRIGVVRGGGVQPAVALRCRVRDLMPWVETATTDELHAVRAARRGDDVLLRASRLPSVPAATRYWGATLLVPLGHRPDPDLPPDVLRAAAGVGPDELLVLGASGADVVPESAFAPLSRAAVRLAAGE